MNPYITNVINILHSAFNIANGLEESESKIELLHNTYICTFSRCLKIQLEKLAFCRL